MIIAAQNYKKMQHFWLTPNGSYKCDQQFCRKKNSMQGSNIFHLNNLFSSTFENSEYYWALFFLHPKVHSKLDSFLDPSLMQTTQNTSVFTLHQYLF